MAGSTNNAALTSWVQEWVGILEPRTMPTAQRHKRQLRLVVLHLGAGMPNMGEVEFSQFGGRERQHEFILA